ncbi:suppressor of fused domain protein [Myxococcus sp. RHST-1-4]|nr:suppressor of fused domain protein [Myxococcus sp. RHSTA-1-4]
MNISTHLESILGSIERGCSASGAPTGVQGCRFRDQPDTSATTYATLGLSHHVLRLKGAREVRQELLLSVQASQARDELAGTLFEVATRMLQDHRALLRGEVVHLGGPILHGTEATALYASSPVLFPESLATFSSTTPPTVFVWLFPVLPSEVRFIVAHGWSAFEGLLERNAPDLLDLHRAPIV